MVEAVCESREVDLGVLAELQHFVGDGRRCLEFPQHGVDPLELGQVTRFGCLHYLGRVDAVRLGNGCNAVQPVTLHRRFGQQADICSIGVHPGCESFDRIDLHAHRLARGVQRQRRHERHLVVRASARLTARALTTEVGVVQLHSATQMGGGLFPRHGAFDLVVQQPGSGVVHPRSRSRASADLPFLA